VAVGTGNGQHLGGHVLGQAVGQGFAVGVDDFADAGDLSSRCRGSACVVAGHQHVHVATGLQRGGHGVQGGALDGRVVVFGNNKCGHVQITLASVFSLFTRVATSATFTPAPRLGGSLTFRVFRRGATSTPRSSGLTVSSGFFLAFMMLGSVT